MKYSCLTILFPMLILLIGLSCDINVIFGIACTLICLGLFSFLALFGFQAIGGPALLTTGYRAAMLCLAVLSYYLFGGVTA